MELVDLAAKGTPFLLLGLLVAVIRLIDQVKSLSKNVEHISDNITWADTCDERHDELNRRVGNLERVTGLNGTRS